MTKKILSLLGVGSLIVLTFFGSMFYTIQRMDIADLIVCSLTERKSIIPNEFCEYYMINYRMTKEDIDFLSEGPGLDFVLNGNDPHKYKIAKILISKGLDVNGINHLLSKDLSPLYSAILSNDIKTVKFLVNNGASTRLVGNNYDMTALDFAKTLQEKKDKENRMEIITFLSSLKGT